MMLGIDDAVAAVGKIASQVIERVWPDPAQQAEAQRKLAELQQNGELARLTAETELAKGQLDINKVEAASGVTWVSGWRPFVGWIGGAAFGYAAIVDPIFRFFAATTFGYTGAFPAIDTSLTMQVLFGILGLGALRTYEKKSGVECGGAPKS
jgi:hypothetical protein